MTIKIHRRTIDGSAEKKILTGLIVSTKFVEEAISFYDPELLETDYVRVVAEWAVKYFQRYGKAIGIHIKDLFDSHYDKMDSAKRDLIADLLANLSNEYERADHLNVPYLLDHAEAYFKSRSLTGLAQQIKGHLMEGDVEEAERSLSGYKRVGRPMSLGGNPFKNADIIQRAFERAEKPLFTMPGALGRMINHELNRDQFIAILGPEKRGKTWWCNEFAIRAAMARNNVALFQIGDMSEEQIVLRLGIRLCGKSNQERYCGEQAMPIPDCLFNQRGKCMKGIPRKVLDPDCSPSKAKLLFDSGKHNHHEPCAKCMGERFWKGSVWYRKTNIGKPLTWRELWKTGSKFLGRTRGRDFKLSVHPSDQLTVTGIKGILDNWEMFEGFIPDVIVIDYADNLAPEDRREDPRHQVNRIWKQLRGLSQERHCLVATATQADGDSYDQTSLTMNNYSEDKRKNAHVTAMIGLNQEAAEKRAGIMRINMIVQRENEFFTEEEISVAQFLKAGRPLVFSF